MKTCRVAITGFGRVGWHVAELLEHRRARYRCEYGADVRLVAVAGSRAGLYDPAGLSWERIGPLRRENGGIPADREASERHTGPGMLNGMEVDVLIETGPSEYDTGGPGYAYMRAALARGVHVIAVSKGALVCAYPELAALARETGAALKISGATAAALPTIDLLTYNLAGCRVEEMAGIFTGTANYVLTRMGDGADLEEAVKEAQARGIAEPDPAFDLDGWDTASKLTILANAGFGANLRLVDVVVEGIRSLAAEQVAGCKAAGRAVKLVGRISRTENGVRAAVRPEVLPGDHPLARVHGTEKAVWVRTDVMGELFVAGGKSDPRAAAAAALKDLEHLLQKGR